MTTDKTALEELNQPSHLGDVIGSVFSHIGLFEGIGGFSLAAKWMGWETKAWCEWNEFGQKVLRHHFPNAEGFGDITKTDFTKYANTIDILTGGFPCQPYSLAGKRKGKEDERHLWPEMLRAVREIRPTYVVGENVFGLINWNGGLVFNEVQSDLEAEGYEVFPFVLPACSKNAPHRRDRVWFVAYASNQRCNNRGDNRQKRCIQGNERTTSEDKSEWNGRERRTWAIGSNVTNTNSANNKTWSFGEILEQQNREKANGYSYVDRTNQWQNFPTQSPICGGNDGIPDKLDGITFPKWRNESIKAFGNAIVPQVAFEIFKALELTHF